MIMNKRGRDGVPGVMKETKTFAAPVEGVDLSSLKAEILIYLETMVENNLKELLEKRQREDTSLKGTDDFFRKRDRYRSTKKLIQYLIRILNDIPDRTFSGPLNPDHFLEFKKLVSFQAGLLGESDVADAILNEFRERSARDHVSIWYYKGIIRNAVNEIGGLVRQAEKPVTADYRKLFEALKKISSFWFFVRKDDEKRIRISDVYIFKLVSALSARFPG